ncbi:GAF domain-containing protein [Microbacterium xylanilyticum]
MATTPDLADLARSLVRVHDAVLSGAAPPERPRELVARSWRRALEFGVDPEGRGRRDPLGPAEVEARRRDSRLALVLDDLRAPLLAAADASSYLVVVTDADGVVLWRSGSARVKHQADALGFTEGAVWTEDAVGTNAIGTALAEAAPVQLFSAEHFENAQVPWYCSAAPIHDPIDGRLLGVVDVSGPALTLHPAIRALVSASASLAEARLWRRHGEHLERLRTAVQPLLAAANEPVLVVDDHGWVAVQRGVSVGPRIDAPRADRAIALPGLGLCVPEPVHGGWIVRPRGGSATVRATLDLTAPQAVLEVCSAQSSWRTALGARPAALLAAIAEHGRAGASAERLSRVVYGDGAHQVTVRAEISRMKRSLGALITASPYAIADGVVLTVSRPGRA